MIIASSQCLGKLFNHCMSLKICRRIVRDVSGRCFRNLIVDFICASCCIFPPSFFFFFDSEREVVVFLVI